MRQVWRTLSGSRKVWEPVTKCTVWTEKGLLAEVAEDVGEGLAT